MDECLLTEIKYIKKLLESNAISSAILVCEKIIATHELVRRSSSTELQLSSPRPIRLVSSSPRSIPLNITTKLKKVIKNDISPRSANVRKYVVKWFKKINRSSPEFIIEHITFGEQIAKGSNSTILMGRYDFNHVAIKRFNRHNTDDVAREFMNEIASLMLIGNHPNIIGFLGAHASEEELYIVFRYYSKGNLNSYMLANEIEVNQKLRWVNELCGAIAALHSIGIVHCDIKSFNILVDDDMSIALADFGISGVERTTHINRGTLRWTDPAILKYNRITFKSDVYSLGVVIWEICTDCSTLPYSSLVYDHKIEDAIISGTVPVFPKCSALLQNLAERCMQLDPDNRPSIEEVSAYLRIAS